MAAALHHHDGLASCRGGRRTETPRVRPVDPIEVERAVLQLRRRLGLPGSPR